MIPPSNRGIKSKRDKEASRVFLIGLDLERFLLQIHIVPYSNRLLMLDIRGRSLHYRTAPVPAAGPIWMGRVHMRVGHTVVMIVRSRQRHRHRRRRVVGRVLVVLWRVRVRVRVRIMVLVLRRVRGCRGEYVSVWRDFGLRRRGRRRRRMVLAGPLSPPAGVASTAAVSHVGLGGVEIFLGKQTNSAWKPLVVLSDRFRRCERFFIFYCSEKMWKIGTLFLFFSSCAVPSEREIWILTEKYKNEKTIKTNNNI